MKLPVIPYPLRAICLSLAFHPFSVFGGTWFDYVNHSATMTRAAKADGKTIWWLRVGPFTLSYRRML